VSNFVTQKRKIESATPDQRMTWLVKDKIFNADGSISAEQLETFSSKYSDRNH
jgi:hypothetical protein